MDVLLYQTNDDGEINVENGVIEMAPGLDNAVYLSLFGGNEDCSARPNCPFTWWGNISEDDDAFKYKSETLFLLKGLPATTGNLHRIEQAAIRDLNWLITNKVASTVLVTVSIPALNRVKILVNIEAEGMESNFEFVENWKASL
ncbi:MAG: hypothetical protein K0U20_08990 [Proteobacteria bacterium]|nr:hypothetical protein [Pseudomonadota bacterium]